MSLRDEFESDPPPQKEEAPVPMGRAVVGADGGELDDGE